MKALVTGGGGFLGAAIVRCLLQKHCTVTSFSRTRHAALAALGVHQYQGDIADPDAVAEAAGEADAVFHVAARTGVWGAYRDYYDTNVRGTQNVIRACRLHGITKLIHTSSPSVVFSGADMQGVNEQVPYPRTYLAHYPKTKAMAERLVLEANDGDLATVVLRPHLIWGPGDNHLVPRIIARGRAGKLRRIGGENKLVDSVYIDNAAAAHVLAEDRLHPGSPVSGRCYFITQGAPMPIWDMINKLLDCARLPPVAGTLSPHVAYMAGWLLEWIYGMLRVSAEPPLTRFVAKELSTAHWFDISAAKRDLGYEATVSIEEGLERLAAHLQQREAPTSDV